MGQGNTWSPTTGIVPGLTLTNNYNAGFQALQSDNSGAAAPANDISAAAVLGQSWLDTSSAGLGKLKKYDGTSWLQWGVMDTANHVWQPVVGGGAATLASATTTDLGSVNPAAVTVSGTTTITSFGSSAAIGVLKFLTFSGALTITFNATSMILPGGASIATSAGDTAVAQSLGGGNWIVLNYQRASGAALLASLSTIPFPAKMHNGTLVASVSGNALTIALKTLAGANPSAGDPVLVTVPNLTGGYSLRTITAALSITVPSTATLGTVSAQANRIWVGYTNNAGTDVLAVYNCLAVSGSNFTLTPWREEETETGTAITTGATSAATWYSSSAFSTIPVAILGYVESTQATAGTWATSPSKVALFGPGTKKPGDTVQRASVVTSTAGSTASATFAALTTGQTISIAPKSAANLIRISTSGTLGLAGASASGGLQISRGTVAATNLIGNVAFSTTGTSGNAFIPAGLLADDVPNTTSSTTYAVQGKSGSGTITYGGATGGQTVIAAEEIQI